MVTLSHITWPQIVTHNLKGFTFICHPIRILILIQLNENDYDSNTNTNRKLSFHVFLFFCCRLFFLLDPVFQRQQSIICWEFCFLFCKALKTILAAQSSWRSIVLLFRLGNNTSNKWYIYFLGEYRFCYSHASVATKIFYRWILVSFSLRILNSFERILFSRSCCCCCECLRCFWFLWLFSFWSISLCSLLENWNHNVPKA